MDLKPEVTYNFSTTAPGILGASVVSAKLIGILNYEMAKSFDSIDLKWRTIFPLLPTGTPDNPASFTFYYFQMQSGAKVVFAEPWIVASSVEVVQSYTAVATIHGLNQQDITYIRDAISALGYTDFTITTTN